MSDMFVFAFKNETGAHDMLAEVGQLQKQQLITISDAATVVRHQDGKVKVKQANSLVGAGALGGAFWGMLIGLLFFAPWLGLVVGAVAGAIGGKLSDYGIDDEFIKNVGATIQPGDSALFLLVEKVTADKVIPALEKYHPTVLQTSLTADAEAKLRAAFGADEAPAETAAEAA